MTTPPSTRRRRATAEQHLPAGHHSNTTPNHPDTAIAETKHAGITPGGDDSRWQASMTVLRGWDPDIVLLQDQLGLPAAHPAREWASTLGAALAATGGAGPDDQAGAHSDG